MKILSIKQTIERVKHKDEAYPVAIKEFINGFKLADNKSRIEIINEEPEFVSQQVINVMVAGLVEELCVRFEIPIIPEWVFHQERRLKKPFYTTNNPKLQAIFLAETPIYYRDRNLFCGKLIGDLVG